MLIDGYDAALFDLDGVIYLGPEAIDGVPESLERLREGGTKIGFVTNNAARTPATVAQHLTELGIRAAETDVVNSTQAMLRILDSELEAGSTLLVLGTDALTEQARGAGFVTCSTAADNPDAVLQGYNPGTTWQLLEEGALAIQQGARWFATNPDMTRPTERGILPGCGSQVQVVKACVAVEPIMAGKPFRPLLDETVLRLEAEHPIFVGDRTDTDILGANVVGMDSLFVFTGAHGMRDLMVAAPEYRPTFIGWDTSALLQEPRTASQDPDGTWACGSARVEIADGVASVTSPHPHTASEELDVAWAALQAHWYGSANIDGIVETFSVVW